MEASKMILQRLPSSIKGTPGILSMDGFPVCVTLEPVNPVPVGIYPCVPHNGLHWQNVWEITNIPGHTAVLFHAGNTTRDTLNCVLVGKGFYPDGITDSRITLNNLRQILPPNFTLTIKGA